MLGLFNYYDLVATLHIDLKEPEEPGPCDESILLTTFGEF